VVADASYLSEVAVGRTRLPGVLDWAVFASSGRSEPSTRS
jgi:hypothetical protein